MVAVEGEPAQKAGAKGEHVEFGRALAHALAAAARLDPAELAGARVQEPEAVAIDPRRMRHRQAADHDLAGLHVDDDTTAGPPVTPAIDGVGPAHGGDVARHARRHGEAA